MAANKSANPFPKRSFRVVRSKRARPLPESFNSRGGNYVAAVGFARFLIVSHKSPWMRPLAFLASGPDRLSRPRKKANLLVMHEKL